MINVALDGPAGSGKSTVAKELAKRLDIGAMYRACALKCLQCDVSVKDENSVSRIIENINIVIDYKNGGQVTLLDGTDVSSDIRKPQISMMASDVSALRCVRMKMVEMQRKIAAGMDCVLDGRDIGSFVLPNAKFKFFLTATPEIRTERRYKELVERGENVVFSDLLEEIKMRDYNDSHRDFAPLKKASDAVVIDTSHMNVEEVVNTVLSYIKESA